MELTLRYILLALFLTLFLFGAFTGEFVETWKNGASL